MNHRYILSLIFCLIQLSPMVCLAFETIPSTQRIPISVHGVSGQLDIIESFLIAEEIDSQDLVKALRPQINLQLKYLVGQIHGLEGGLELHLTKINELEKLESLSNGLARYRYTATINAVLSSAWVLSSDESLSLSLYLPKQVDELSLKAIYDRYSSDCIPNPHRSYADTNYWYYFRPQAYYCPLREQQQASEQLISIDLIFTPHPKQTSEVYPRYDSMWSDGKLVVTSVYALVGGLLGEQGQEAYEMVFKDLVRTYGTPIEINNESLLNRAILDIDTPIIEATFTTPKGPLEVHLFLINSLDKPSHYDGDELTNFIDHYNALTQVSDLVIYNGHARYGSDNTKLDAIGTSLAQHHQLFFVNTCASYTYGMPNSTQRVYEVNQEKTRPSDFLDLIVNAMPAMGHEIAYMNLRYINALVLAQESYQSILKDMYPKQQMLVLSSQDNDLKNDRVQSDPAQVEAELRIAKGQSASGCDAHKNSACMPFYILLILFLIVTRRAFLSELKES